ncbi:MAG TPA: peptide-methionine (R)-S-oxide reductase MsrB [Pyrinomonadaceae bacterium]|jgi:peptide-methionine (R)-S-oxide reductase
MRVIAAIILLIGLTAIISLGIGSSSQASTPSVVPNVSATPTKAAKMTEAVINDDGVFDLIEFDGNTVIRSDDEWKRLLTPQQFYILRQAGTEAPYSGALEKNHERGVYYCAACGLALFRSKAKFESGTGWPSFYEPIYKKNVIQKDDRSLPEEDRTEILCPRCHSHLGHVFDDGPPPTGLRYCMNSLALKFKATK